MSLLTMRAGSRIVSGPPSSIGQLPIGQLPAGHFTAAKMPMTVTHPRPNAETSVDARHRKAYPGIANRIPVAVQGGAYPFMYSIIAAPAGATIGANITDADYGVFSWNPATDGSAQTITVRMTDQEGATIDATWTMTADAASFVFLDAAVGTSGSGTIASPFKLWPDAFGTVSTDLNNNGKILVLRGGAHTLVGYADTSNNLRLRTTHKPFGWMAYPGESPSVDCATAVINLISTDGNDLSVQGIAFTNARADVEHSRFFFFGGSAGNRALFHDTSFTGIGRGTIGNDNPGAIVMFSGSVFREYVTLLGISGADYEAPIIGSLYRSRYVVIERVSLDASRDGTVDQIVWTKDIMFEVSVRRCVSLLTNSISGVLMNQFNSGVGLAQRAEFCYNLVYVPDSSVAFSVNWENSTVAVGSILWGYRNTFVGRVRALSAANYNWTADLDDNVIITNDSPVVFSDAGSKVAISGNLTATRANIGTILDGNYLLTGAERTANLGRKGHEISGGV